MLFSVLGDQKALERMALETIAFSEFMVLFGARFYLLSLESLVETFSGAVPTQLGSAIKAVVAHMAEIGNEWDW